MTEEGSPRVLAQVARRARMLVVGRSRSRGPQRLVHTQADLLLAARAGCPVVVVPLSWQPSLLDRKVAVGIDRTALSAEALEFALGIAADRQGDLVVIHSGLPSGHAISAEHPECSWINRATYVLSECPRPTCAGRSGSIPRYAAEDRPRTGLSAGGSNLSSAR